MESEDRDRIEKRLDELSGYLLANVFFTNAIVALTATPRQLSILTDNLETSIDELETVIADEGPHGTEKHKASRFYLSLAIGDIKQKYLNDKE